VVEHLIATERLKQRRYEIAFPLMIVVEHLIATERLKHGGLMHLYHHQDICGRTPYRD